jgi:hypothetical protein
MAEPRRGLVINTMLDNPLFLLGLILALGALLGDMAERLRIPGSPAASSWAWRSDRR